MDRLRQLVGLLMVVVSGYLTFALVNDSSEHKALAEDLAELQHIKHGLLDTSEWADRLGALLDDKLDQVTQNQASQAELRPVVSELVDASIEGIRQSVIEEHGKPSTLFGLEDQTGLSGELKRKAINAGFEAISTASPQITTEVLNKLTQPDGPIQQAVRSKVAEVKATTHSAVNRKALKEVMARRGCDEAQLEQCQASIVAEMNTLSDTMSTQPALIMLLFGVFLLWALIGWRSLGQLDVVLLISGSFTLLLGGVLTPMMNIEAKLNELSFTLMGEPMSFTNQVVFFQSKSIFDVVEMLTSSGVTDMVIVGVLIATFSMGFPTLKLIASFVYYYGSSALRDNALVSFFALKSGKWSMADVFVIALFMAFIGFGGLIDGQLSQLASDGSGGLKVIPAANGTSFQAGLYLFTGFCIASLCIGGLLEKLAQAGLSGAGPSEPQEAA